MRLGDPMKKLTFISSLLFVALLIPSMADDTRYRPFAWHGSATRIAADGSLKAKPSVSNPLSWLVKPLKPISSRAVSPSGGGSASGGKSMAQCLGSKLCPVNWFRKKPAAQ